MKLTQDNKNLLTNIGIGLAAYIIVIRPIFQKLGIVKTGEEIQKEKTEAANIQDVEKNLNALGISLSKTKAEWDAIANTIYNNLRYSALDDNLNDAGYQVARVKNDADVFYLIKTFGKRQEYFFGIPTGSPKSLVEFINSNLTRDNINLINDNYSRKGMKFKF
jgi:hypothetical protein